VGEMGERAAAGQVGAGWAVGQSGVREGNSIRRSEVAYYMRLVLRDVECACAESGGWVSEVLGLACESSLFIDNTRRRTGGGRHQSHLPAGRRQQSGRGCKCRKQRTRACRADKYLWPAVRRVCDVDARLACRPRNVVILDNAVTQLQPWILACEGKSSGHSLPSSPTIRSAPCLQAPSPCWPSALHLLNGLRPRPMAQPADRPTTGRHGICTLERVESVQTCRET
jgi:hypothetical protein